MAEEVSRNSVSVDCVYLEMELLELQPDTSFGDHFGMQLVPTEQAKVTCENCSLELKARIGWRATMCVYNKDPEGFCARLRSEPDAS